MKKRSLLVAALVVFPAALFCQMQTAELLQAYLERDTELQRLAAQAEQAALSGDEAKINNGVSVQLATGTVTFRTSGNNLRVTLSPEAQVALPQASNLSLSARTNVAIGADGGDLSDTKLSASVDIISSAADTRNVTLLQAERAVLEAERNVQNRALSAERDFYNELKSLYTLASSIAQAEKSLYDDEIELDNLRAQGYSQSSSTYRAKELEVLGDRHDIEINTRSLSSNMAVFLNKCGVDWSGSEDARSLLPVDIPSVEPVDFLSFDKEDFAEIESAKWTAYINSLSRAANKNFSLALNGGYTFANSNTGSDSADAGATLSWQGLSATAGVEIPTAGQTQGSSPALTFSLTLNPNAFRLASISKQQDALNERREALAISAAERSYDTTLVSRQTSLSNILWEKQLNGETYSMYDSLAADNQNWFSQGIITESELRSAEVNRELYRIRIISNDIDLIIYNNETRLLFCRDAETNGGAE